MATTGMSTPNIAKRRAALDTHKPGMATTKPRLPPLLVSVRVREETAHIAALVHVYSTAAKAEPATQPSKMPILASLPYRPKSALSDRLSKGLRVTWSLLSSAVARWIAVAHMPATSADSAALT
eukprot:Opistho-2@75619